MAPTELYKYNPDRCSAEERAKTFVARQPIIDGILDDLRKRMKAPANQHYLITGARGNGKTTLLLMVRDQIQCDATLAKVYQPIRFNEEEYSITSLRDLFHRTADLILEATPDEGLKQACGEIDKARDEEEGTERAISAVREYSRRTGRKLVLLIDNLDLILGQQVTDKTEQGRLRDLLMNDSFLVLVAAAPKHFEEVSGYDKPFYQFFRHVDLGELTSEQMDELIRKRAEWDGNTRMIENFDAIEPRLRALEHLTGGNPRLTLMLYQVFAHNELAEVRTALTQLLDDITPFYRDRLNDLSAQQRKVIDVFAKRGRPSTPTELAEDLRLPVNQVNSILQRLKEAGFVALAKQKRRKSTLYVVSERMFRIWHQMRFSREGRRKLEFLVEFLREWYTAAEWKEQLARLLSEYRRSTDTSNQSDAGRTIEYLDYLVAAAPNSGLRLDATDEMLRACIESGNWDHAQFHLEQSIIHAQTQRDRKTLARCWFRMAHLRFAQADRNGEIAALRESRSCNPEDPLLLYRLGERMRSLAASCPHKERLTLLTEARSTLEVALEHSPNPLQAQLGLAKTWFDLAEFHIGDAQKSDLLQSCSYYETVAIASPKLADAWLGWGIALGHLADFTAPAHQERLLHDARDKLFQALKLSPHMPTALENLGVVFGAIASLKADSERRHLLEEACVYHEAAIRLDPMMAMTFHNYGCDLLELARTTGKEQQEELLTRAQHAYEQALEKALPTHETLSALGLVLFERSTSQTGVQKDHLLEQAIRRVSEALRIARQQRSGTKGSSYAAGMIALLLARCRFAVESADVGAAFRFFRQAMNLWAISDHKAARPTIVAFFKLVSKNVNSSICSKLLELMIERKMQDELLLVGPFLLAVDYWQNGRNAEILDQLNPEIREVVEEIIRRGEEAGEDTVTR